MARRRNIAPRNPLYAFGWGPPATAPQPYSNPFGGFGGLDAASTAVAEPPTERDIFSQDPFSADFLSQQGRWGPRAPQEPSYQITPEEEKSLIAKAKEWTMSGLGAVGNLLDVPGSMVRDVVAGENPLDQLLHPFSSEGRTTGRDLARKWGWAGPEDTVGNFMGGLGIDILADPLTYATLGVGALGKAGRAAKAAGLLSKTTPSALEKILPGVIGKRTMRLLATPQDLLNALPVAKQPAAQKAFEKALGKGTLTSEGELAAALKEPLGGAFGVGLPFRPPAFTYRGPGALPIAHGLDVFGNAIRYSWPVRALAGSMNAKMLGTTGKFMQERTPELFEAIPEATAAARGVLEPINKMRLEMGLTDPDASRMLGTLLEATPAEIDPAAKAIVAAYPKATEGGLKSLRSEMLRVKNEARARGLPLGTAPEELIDVAAEHFPRYMPHEVGYHPGLGRKSQNFSTMTGSELSRKDPFRGIPNPRETLGDLYADPAINRLIKGGASEDDFAAAIERLEKGRISRNNLADAVERLKKGGATRDDLAAVIKRRYGPAGANRIPVSYEKRLPDGTMSVEPRYPVLADILRDTPEQVRLSRLFGNDVGVDLAKYVQDQYIAATRGEFVLDSLARPGVMGAKGSPEGTVRLGDLLENLGMKHGDVNQGALRSLAERAKLSVTRGELDVLKEARIPKEIADDLLEVQKRFTAPKPVGEIAKWFDSLNNFWKSVVTATARFHGRNFGSGQVQAGLQFGAGPFRELPGFIEMSLGKDVASYVSHPLVMAEAAQQGIAHLDAKTATNIMRDLVHRHEVVERFAGEAAQRSGPGAAPLGKTFWDLVEGYPGGFMGQKSPPRTDLTWKLWKDKTPTIRGVGETGETSWRPLAFNEAVGHGVESANRVPSWIALTREGVDPNEAKRMVEAAQVAYGSRHYTPFEQQFLMRLFPFGKFGSRMALHTGRTLARKPGGALAQTIMATNRLQGEPDELLPDYVRQTMAIPLGPEGRYLTGFGLMHENPLQYFGGGITGGGLEMASQLSPLVKGPLEKITGQSFFQRGPMGGRELQDMDPLLGRTLRNVSRLTSEDTETRPVSTPPLLELALGESPLSPLLTHARTMTDPRKGWGAVALNLLTGARIVDVPPAARRAVLDEALQAMIRSKAGAKVFSKAYVPKAALAAMDPAERKAAEQLQALSNMMAREARAEAKQRKQAATAP